MHIRVHADRHAEPYSLRCADVLKWIGRMYVFLTRLTVVLMVFVSDAKRYWNERAQYRWLRSELFIRSLLVVGRCCAIALDKTTTQKINTHAICGSNTIFFRFSWTRYRKVSFRFDEDNRTWRRIVKLDSMTQWHSEIFLVSEFASFQCTWSSTLFMWRIFASIRYILNLNSSLLIQQFQRMHCHLHRSLCNPEFFHFFFLHFSLLFRVIAVMLICLMLFNFIDFVSVVYP